MKKLFINLKNVFRYAKKELAYTWIFFMILSLASNSPHNFFELILLSGIMTVFVAVMATIRNTLL